MTSTGPRSSRAPASTWASPARQDAARAASIGSALTDIDGVAAVSAGPYYKITGSGPGTTSTPGVHVNDDRVEVHIVAHYGVPLQRTAANIDTALHTLLDGRDLQVVVDDILLPGEQLTSEAPMDPEAHTSNNPAAADGDQHHS